ncbi:MAG: hypothetical protein D6826_06415 [Alphaproteobacteria bacterium]|nr:MAG: hypothetical protein D6826_06415 [Alphaproteobacteria bacterium]
MPEPIAAEIRAAAALLLRAPDEQVVTILSEGEEPGPQALAAARQDYFEVICIPQSGRFVPPYEHVVRAARRDGEMWFFPPARYDGGDVVAHIFRNFGFERRALDVEPLWAPPHLPADHLGFMLAFVAWGLDGLAKVDDVVHATWSDELAWFVEQHLDGWTEIYADLLADRGGTYLGAVADAVWTSVELVRETLAPVSAGGASVIGTDGTHAATPNG